MIYYFFFLLQLGVTNYKFIQRQFLKYMLFSLDFNIPMCLCYYFSIICDCIVVSNLLIISLTLQLLLVIMKMFKVCSFCNSIIFIKDEPSVKRWTQNLVWLCSFNLFCNFQHHYCIVSIFIIRCINNFLE